MAKRVTLTDVKNEVHADTYSKVNGVFTLRWEFFYRMGQTEQDKVELVKKAFPTANIIDAGENYRPFRGGASTANSSHWFVKFTVEG